MWPQYILKGLVDMMAMGHTATEEAEFRLCLRQITMEMKAVGMTKKKKEKKLSWETNGF